MIRTFSFSSRLRQSVGTVSNPIEAPCTTETDPAVHFITAATVLLLPVNIIPDSSKIVKEKSGSSVELPFFVSEYFTPTKYQIGF